MLVGSNWLGKTNFLPYLTKSFAKIVATLDCKLDFKVFMVGFYTYEVQNYPSVFIEPEADADALPVDDIEALYKSVAIQYKEIPEIDMPEGKRNMAFVRHAEFCSFLGQELRDLMIGAPVYPAYKPFYSIPVQVDNHLISIVLLVSRQDYLDQPHLDEDVSYEYGKLPCLISAIAEEFLRKYSGEMNRMQQVRMYLSSENDPKELIRSAGAAFAKVTSNADRVKRIEDAKHVDLNERFEACNAISAMNYEGAAGKGGLVISRHPDDADAAIVVEVKLREEVPISKHRKVRKLLAMCGEGTWLLSNQNNVYGLGRVDWAKYNQKRENLFVIRFVKHHCWELVHRHGDDFMILMRTEYNEPQLPKPKFDRDRLRRTLKTRLTRITVKQIEHILKLAQGASNSNHGAMLVISDDAAGEAERLKKDCFAIKPQKLTPEQIRSAAEMDGATLLSKDGKCHALGVILDGKSADEADSSRGARYNSAVRYVEQHREAVAIVVSEDGMVNIIPERLASEQK